MRAISLKQQARFTGIMYILFAASAIYGYMYAMKQINVSGNIVATAKNIVAQESLYRTSIATGVITNILFVIVVLMLYHLLKQSGIQMARLMVGLVMIGIPVVLVAVATKVTALYILKGEILTSFSTQQVQEIATGFIRLGNFGAQLSTILWGLWLFPLGLLVYRCGFIPKLLGILLMVNGVGYVVTGFAFIILPDLHGTISKVMYPTYFLGEIPFMLYLAIKGIKNSSKERQKRI